MLKLTKLKILDQSFGEKIANQFDFGDFRQIILYRETVLIAKHFYIYKNYQVDIKPSFSIHRGWFKNKWRLVFA